MNEGHLSHLDHNLEEKRTPQREGGKGTYYVQYYTDHMFRKEHKEDKMSGKLSLNLSKAQQFKGSTRRCEELSE